MPELQSNILSALFLKACLSLFPKKLIHIAGALLLCDSKQLTFVDTGKFPFITIEKCFLE